MEANKLRRGSRILLTVITAAITAHNSSAGQNKRGTNSNAGHVSGTALTTAQKRDLLEYLKTL